MGLFSESRWQRTKVAAFTLTELLVVVAIIALVVATQLPALTKAQSPAKDTRCLSNLRQIGIATQQYKDNNDDYFPFGARVNGGGTGPGSVVDPTGWPMQLLSYLGGYVTNTQPNVFMCPSERRLAAGWVFQVHYAANRYLISNVNDNPTKGVRAFQVRDAPRYWMFIEKDPGDFCAMASGYLGVNILQLWNMPPGYIGLRRHNNGTSSTAADGHVESLLTPEYKANAPSPLNFLELGDCANGVNPASSWQDPTTYTNHNGYRVKLYSRLKQTSLGTPPF